MDRAGGARVAEPGDRQRLCRGLNGEPAGALVDHRQAAAIAGDRGAVRDLGGIEAGVEDEAGDRPGRNRAHPTEVGDDAGEHFAYSRSLASLPTKSSKSLASRKLR